MTRENNEWWNSKEGREAQKRVGIIEPTPEEAELIKIKNLASYLKGYTPTEIYTALKSFSHEELHMILAELNKELN